MDGHFTDRSYSRSISPSRAKSAGHRDRYRDRSPHRRHGHRLSPTSAQQKQHDSKHRSRRHDDRHHHRHRELSPVSAAPPMLPYNARQLSKHDLSQFEPMFAMYLDIQKRKILEDMNDEEARGRFKSFVKKWNRGELAEGWYDPATFEKAQGSMSNLRTTRNRDFTEASQSLQDDAREGSYASENRRSEAAVTSNEEEEEEEEDYGPKLPSGVVTKGVTSGPTIPKLDDLELQREQARLDAEAARSDAHAQYRHEISTHKAHLRAFQDEVAPRAEPGTHERKLEKKRERAAANREFASGRRGGSPAMDAAPDTELMGGGGDDDLSALKKAKEQETRKRNERELRREEILHARKVEREERLAEYKKKEEETMSWLKALAKQRFG